MNLRRTPSTFDPNRVPLSGWNLVEASAGTGKTYALAGLYVRLLIESVRRTAEYASDISEIVLNLNIESIINQHSQGS